VVDAVIVRKVVNLDVPIRVVVTGEMADGFNITKAYALPEKVRVTAPPSVAKELKEITTKPIDITSLVASTAVNAELDFPENVSGKKQSVKVHFVIERL
jgi:YbbR domain-containing protein